MSMDYVKLSTKQILSICEGENVVKKRNENRSYSDASFLFI